MSEIISMFSHPVLTIDNYPKADAIADEYREKSLALVEEFPNAGLISNAWASIYGRDHFVPQHTHPMSHLSLVFYAAATEGTGHLVFENPARGHFQHFYPPEISWLHYRFSIQPKKGLFVVFPSYLAHNTEPHESDELRVIYSANLQLQYTKAVG